MKRSLSTSIAALATIFLTSQALATDLGGGSSKDTPDYGSPVHNVSGLYVSGTVGVANGDRDVSRTISRDIGLEIDTTGIDPQDVQDAHDDLQAVGIPSTINADNLTIPLIADKLSGNGSDDIDGMVYGAEVSYLYQFPGRRFGLEVGLGATFYDDADSANVHVGEVGTYTGGTAASDFNFGGGLDCTAINTCAGDPSFYSQSGFIAFGRDYDIDLIARVHYFITEQLAVNVGGGVSWAQANVSGASVVDSTYTGLNTRFDEDVSSVGFVLTAGLNYWVTDRIVVGAAYEYKPHSFDVDASATDTFALGPDARLIGNAHDSAEIEDKIHAIKARVSIKLN